MPLGNNFVALSDSYKVSHHKQYPPGTTHIYSYFECRGGEFKAAVFFGLQYILKRWFCGSVVTHESIDEAKLLFSQHIVQDIFNESGWRYIVDKHEGRLPLRIKAVPEGSVVPVSNVLLTVENTDPNCFWLTNYVETIICQVWYPLTVATNSREQKKILHRYLSKTADNFDCLPFQLHDFGFRGVSSYESAAIGGAAHLVNFRGTDTVPALLMLKEYYSCPMAGFSVPAAEHSTITSWQPSGEKAAYENMLDKFPTGIVACVSDSYDIFTACDSIWGKDLKVKVEKRQGRLVIRPDSGDPVTVLLKVLHILGSNFGYSENSKGYKILPPYLRVLQGDHISLKTLGGILEQISEAGWSTENLIFGSGGALLQCLNRDTLKCAYKCSSVVVDDKRIDVYKDPITDPGKVSKKGLLTLEKNVSNDPDENWMYVTKTQGSGLAEKDELITVFENGKLIIDQTLDEIRKRAALPDELIS